MRQNMFSTASRTDDYVKAVNEVADSMTFDNGKEVLKKIKNLVLLCGKMEEELGDLVPLIQDIKDTHKRPEPQITRPLNLPPEA